MGYDSNFSGSFSLNKPLTEADKTFLKKFAETRRMKRKIDGYGVDGEFFVDGSGFNGDGDDSTIVDYNEPPRTQPGLWCQWIPNEDGTAILWDGGEKFYDYVKWIEYLIDKILKPRGYVLNGEVYWQGEEPEDMGCIVIKNNVVKTKHVKLTYVDD
jgi:hypothetical protein